MDPGNINLRLLLVVVHLCAAGGFSFLKTFAPKLIIGPVFKLCFGWKAVYRLARERELAVIRKTNVVTYGILWSFCCLGHSHAKSSNIGVSSAHKSSFLALSSDLVVSVRVHGGRCYDSMSLRSVLTRAAFAVLFDGNWTLSLERGPLTKIASGIRKHSRSTWSKSGQNLNISSTVLSCYKHVAGCMSKLFRAKKCFMC